MFVYACGDALVRGHTPRALRVLRVCVWMGVCVCVFVGVGGCVRGCVGEHVCIRMSLSWSTCIIK